MKKWHFLFFVVFPFAGLHAQDFSKIRFGDVTKDDLNRRYDSIDAHAGAVVIADIGSLYFVGNSRGWFSLAYRHFKRIHVLNKNAFDAASVSIPVYKDELDEIKLDRLKASTYSLENGKLTETRLDGKHVFTEKIDRNRSLRKFTFPNLKEGSIIEYEYTTISDFIQFPEAWEFQGNYPRLWSEFSFEIPSFFTYVFLQQGYLNVLADNREGFASFNLRIPGVAGQSQPVQVNSVTTRHHWVVKNAPALSEENFTSSIQNHLEKIQFQLSQQREPLPEHQYTESWTQVTEKLLEAENFGAPLANEAAWFRELADNILKDIKGKVPRAKKIFHYVQDNFTCVNGSALWLEKSFRQLARERSGSVAEINLFLVALLRQAGITADPVILSTRDHGFSYEPYPILSQFNYVIARILLEEKAVYLDGSVQGLGFGQLPLRCMNEQARVVNENAGLLRFSADSMVERKNTSVFLAGEKGILTGNVIQSPGNYESMEYRRQIRDKGRDRFLRELENAFGAGAVISASRIDSLADNDSPLLLNYRISLPLGTGTLVYVNPMFGEGYRENPFKAASRSYPVEMPYAIDETYSLLMELPEGYSVEELPSENIVRLNAQGDGLFEYRVSRNENNISLRCRLYLRRANFEPEEYEALRSFFSLVVKKHAEPIVLIKKK